MGGVTVHKAFVVADIPEPHKTRVQAMRDELKSVTAKLPVEITLAGSAGVGPIPEGTDIALISREVDRIARTTAAFTMEFGEIAHFPNTGIFFIAARPRGPFDALHAAFAASRIPFGPSAFPYNPHCTLRVGPAVDAAMSERIYGIPVPRGEIRLDTISVYALDPRTFGANLLRRATLAER
jgi:2'-5' RNA ligase